MGEVGGKVKKSWDHSHTVHLRVLLCLLKKLLANLLLFPQGDRGFDGLPGLPGNKGHKVSYLAE